MPDKDIMEAIKDIIVIAELYPHAFLMGIGAILFLLSFIQISNQKSKKNLNQNPLFTERTRTYERYSGGAFIGLGLIVFLLIHYVPAPTPNPTISPSAMVTLLLTPTSSSDSTLTPTPTSFDIISPTFTLISTHHASITPTISLTPTAVAANTPTPTGTSTPSINGSPQPVQYIKIPSFEPYGVRLAITADGWYQISYLSEAYTPWRNPYVSGYKGWSTKVDIFIDQPVQWGSTNSVILPIDFDDFIGSDSYFQDKNDAISAAKGDSRTFRRVVGDYFTFICVDERGKYADNQGIVILSVTYLGQ